MTTLETKQAEYKNVKSQLANIINSIVEAGELTEEQKTQIESLTSTYNTKKIEVQKDIEKTKESYNNSKYDYLQNQISNLKSNIEKSDDLIQFSVSGVVDGEEQITLMKLDIEGVTTRVGDLEDIDNFETMVTKFYISTSRDELIGGSWLDRLPPKEQQQGKFVWLKYVTTYSSGVTKETEPICITAQNGKNGTDGVSVEEIIIQYAKNQSTTSAPTTGWSASMPSYQEGYYLWWRTRIKWSNSSSYQYSDPVCDESWKVNAQTYSEYKQLRDKFSWIVKGGTSSSNMELTDKMYSLITEKVLIEAKKIELNGSININNGLFRVLTNGNTKIGGDTGNTVEGYARALLEITSNGNLFSVSPDSSKVYTKLSEGTIKVVNSSYTLTIDDAFASNKDAVLRSSLNSSVGGQGGSVWLCCNGGDIKTEGSRAIRYFKNSDDNYVFRPNSTAGVMYNGTASYPWKEVIAKTLTQTSDRTLKENITYLSNALSDCDLNNNISIDDCYDFVSNDLPIAIYNYMDDMAKKIGFIAQDIIYNADETDNKVGQLIVDPRGYTTENGKLTYDLGNFVSVLAAALQVAIRKIKQLEGIINGSN